MHTKILTDKMLTREHVVMLLTVAYVFYQCMYFPLFAEYIEAPIGDQAIKSSQETEDIDHSISNEWSSVKSDYFVIYYKADVDLKAIERKLRKRKFYVDAGIKPGYLSGSAEKVAYRMDVLFRRAREILGMYPRNMNTVIKIFRNRRELNEEYYRIFRRKRSLKSFYIYRFDTIYTTADDISDSVMAHEMGHAIVDHYFVVRPPEKVREILAMYVDLHLDD